MNSNSMSLLTRKETLDPLIAAESGSPRQSVAVFSDDTGITSSRDGAANILRYLKFWYDLPSDCFQAALVHMDKFLYKVKAKPRHMPCIALAAFHLACRQFQLVYGDNWLVPDPKDLVCISQSRRSASDVEKMEAMLVSKLFGWTGNQPSRVLPLTPLTFLRAMLTVCRTALNSLEISLEFEGRPLPCLVHQLEIISCDSYMLRFCSSELVLALLQYNFQSMCMNNPRLTDVLMRIIFELRTYCVIRDQRFRHVYQEVAAVLEKYYQDNVSPYRQKLEWRISKRTMRYVVRPKFRCTLPKISEEVLPRISKLGDLEYSLESDSGKSTNSDIEGSDSSDSEMENSDVEIQEPKSWARVVAGS